MKNGGLFVAIAPVVTLCACATLNVSPPYRQAPAGLPSGQLSRLIVHDQKEGVPPYLPYGWMGADYVVITTLDGKDLGKRGALLGAPVTGDFEFPKEADIAAGLHTISIGVMTSCGFMELDTQFTATAGTIYEAYGIIKNTYAMNYGQTGGGCQASAPIYHRNADGELVK